MGGDLAASPLGVVPESFPGNVGYFCSAGKELSYWKERCQINHQTSAQTSQEVCVCINPFFKGHFHLVCLKDPSKIVSPSPGER